RHLPLLADALAAGDVTVDHVRAMSRCLKRWTLEAFLRDEAMLTEDAIAFDADDFALVVAKWLLVNDPGSQDPGNDSSELYVSAMLDGRHRLDGQLDLEDSAEFLAELDTVYDELWRQDHTDAARLGTLP